MTFSIYYDVIKRELQYHNFMIDRSQTMQQKLETYQELTNDLRIVNQFFEEGKLSPLETELLTDEIYKRIMQANKEYSACQKINIIKSIFKKQKKGEKKNEAYNYI